MERHDHSDAVSKLTRRASWQDFATALGLSKRELEIVEHLLALEDNDAAIAAALGISRHTVHTHLLRLYRKLGVNSRSQLVATVMVAYIDHAYPLSPTTPGMDSIP
jgi:DNA-binding CsgD family transcriptional regulator